jgi:hypothetical protein
MADEYDLLAEWITSSVNADSTALDAIFAGISQRVYDTTVVQNAVYPYIVFTFLTSEDDLMYNSARRVWASFWIELIVIGRNIKRSALAPVASRLDDLLHRGEGVVTGGEIKEFTRRRPSYRVQIDGDTIYRYVGGIYVARVQAI